jgi:translation initiation factor 1 (eIF-1/SUI1)
MSLHITKFIDRIKAAESRGQRDMVMSLQDAKDLHADITKLLLALQATISRTESVQPTEIEIQGGSF